MIKPLEGIRVLDLSSLLPGPLCSWYLQEMGADVLKVEAPGLGDNAKHLNPEFYQLLNSKKEIITLDLKTSREEFLKLISEADVLLEGFRPGVMKKLGLDYSSLKKQNPKLIYCSLTGFGQKGPQAEQPGHDINYLALSGILHQTGEQNRPPSLSNFQIADVAGGSMHACMAITTALFHRERKGEGSHLDVSMHGGSMTLAPIIQASVLRKQDPSRGADFLSGGLPRYAVYETNDGRFMALGALEDKFWQKFCEQIERPDLIEASPDQNLKNELKQIFKSKDFQKWCQVFQDGQACCSPVLTPREAFEKYSPLPFPIAYS